MAEAPNFSGGTAVKPKSKNQKILLFGGLGVGVLGGIWYYEKNKSASSAASATADQSGIDPNTGVPYSQEAIDPSTGVPYADEASYSGIGTTPGALGTYNPLTQQYTPGYGTPTASVTGTNAEWAQAAESFLTNLGYDPATVAGAIGAYLQGSPLSSDQYSIVQAALGFEGNPPTNVAPPMQSNPGGSGSSSTGLTGVATQTSIGSSFPFTTLYGESLSQVLSTLQNNGIIVNEINDAAGNQVNATSGAARKVSSIVYHPTGQAGQYQANSVSVAVQ